MANSRHHLNMFTAALDITPRMTWASTENKNNTLPAVILIMPYVLQSIRKK